LHIPCTGKLKQGKITWLILEKNNNVTGNIVYQNKTPESYHRQPNICLMYIVTVCSQSTHQCRSNAAIIVTPKEFHTPPPTNSTSFLVAIQHNSVPNRPPLSPVIASPRNLPRLCKSGDGVNLV